MKVISVIIPIYNVERYVRQSVDSVLNQDFNDTEIILVNDGSTDGSQNICRGYAGINDNVKVIDKPNGGLSDARNAGIDIATGKYVYFLDGDDWLEPNALSTLYNFAESQHCDIVQGGFYYTYSDHLLFDNRYLNCESPFTLSRVEAMTELIKNQYIKNFAWGKLYKRDIVSLHKFPVGKYYEDSYWQHLVVHEAVSYGVIPAPLYYYRQRQNGISGQFSVRNLDLLKGYESRLEFVNFEYPDLVKPLVQMFWHTAYSFYSLSLGLADENERSVYQEYWSKINDKYSLLFNVCLSRDLEYRLVKCNSRALKLYQFSQKVYRRLFDKHLKRIDL